jgi:hypothetical protein
LKALEVKEAATELKKKEAKEKMEKQKKCTAAKSKAKKAAVKAQAVSKKTSKQAVAARKAATAAAASVAAWEGKAKPPGAKRKVKKRKGAQKPASSKTSPLRTTAARSPTIATTAPHPPLRPQRAASVRKPSNGWLYNDDDDDDLFKTSDDDDYDDNDDDDEEEDDDDEEEDDDDDDEPVVDLTECKKGKAKVVVNLLGESGDMSEREEERILDALENRELSPEGEVEDPDSWDDRQAGWVSGDDELSDTEIIYDLSMEDVQLGDIVVFGVKEEESGEWEFALGKVRLRKVKDESFRLQYLEPVVAGERGGRYKEAFEGSNASKRTVQWRVSKDLSNLLCRVNMPGSGKLGVDIAKELTDRVQADYFEDVLD